MTEAGDFLSPDDGTGLVSEGVDAPKPSPILLNFGASCNRLKTVSRRIPEMNVKG